MRINPLMTRSPVTGALRHVTADLLGEAYLVPRAAAAVKDHLRPGAPWSESFAAAPEETAQAVEAGLVALAHATPSLDPTDILADDLPAGRARSHLTGLRDLWCDLGTLPGPLNTWRHVLQSQAGDALEPLPLIGADCAFSTPAEAGLPARDRRRDPAQRDHVEGRARRAVAARQGGLPAAAARRAPPRRRPQALQRGRAARPDGQGLGSSGRALPRHARTANGGDGADPAGGRWRPGHHSLPHAARRPSCRMHRVATCRGWKPWGRMPPSTRWTT